MNSKIFWGLVIVVLSLFKFIPEDIMKYIVNYQVVMVLVGVYFLVKKKKHGWIFLGIGVYLYITHYVWEDLPLFIVPLILGLAVMGLGIKEIVDKRQLTKFSNKNTKERKEKVIEAEEEKK
ncbi:hypothetical protein [Leptotrichia shahii]|jgi:hypothetical protein cdivTM_03800|uniref:hypothetical protein n=1 Tax=Leptotrichia shahii TaxID=157691 RepID=UPI0028D3F743|nr:hypothetical protein [Leptotrichia shahii]